jgi:hypothetical protein
MRSCVFGRSKFDESIHTNIQCCFYVSQQCETKQLRLCVSTVYRKFSYTSKETDSSFGRVSVGVSLFARLYLARAHARHIFSSKRSSQLSRLVHSTSVCSTTSKLTSLATRQRRLLDSLGCRRFISYTGLCNNTNFSTGCSSAGMADAITLLVFARVSVVLYSKAQALLSSSSIQNSTLVYTCDKHP